MGPAVSGALMPRLAGRDRLTRESRRPSPFREGTIRPPLLARPRPHHARIALERHEPLSAVGPVLRLVDADMIDRLTPGAAVKQRARDVDHVARACTLVDQRRAAAPAEAARCACRLVLVARDFVLAGRHAKALTPHTHIGRIDRAMREPARARVVMPGPEGRIVDLERDRAAETAGRRRWRDRRIRVSSGCPLVKTGIPDAAGPYQGVGLTSSSTIGFKHRPDQVPSLHGRTMTMRPDYNKVAPGGVKALGGLYGYVMQSGLSPSWLNLSICVSRRSTTAPIASTCIPATSSRRV